MKKFFSLLSIFTLSLLLFSCSKEDNRQSIETEDNMVTLTFSAEKVGGTKTAAVEGASSVSYNWTDDDIANIKLFKVNNGNISEEVASPVVTKVSDRKLTITATVEANATYTFRAVLSKEYTGSGDNYVSRKPKISVSQSPNGITNFDPTADILVSDDLTVTVGDSDNSGAMELLFRRMVVINKMTLKNMTEGEKVNRITISSDKDLTAYLSTTSNQATHTPQNKEITLNYDNVKVPEGGQFPVYFVTMPNEGHTLTVSVYTDQYTYSKTFGAGAINFYKGQFTTFGVTLPAGEPVVSFANGDYVIANATGNKIAKKYVSGNNLSDPLTVTLSEGNLIYPYGTVIDDYTFTFTKVVGGNYDGMFTIEDQDGNYLYAAGTGNNNHLKAKSTLDASCYWTISEETDGSHNVVATLHSTNRNTIRNNVNIFSCYQTGSQAAIKLYPIANVIEDPTPIITVTSDNPMSVENTSGSHTINYTLIHPVGGSALTASTSQTWITNIDCTVEGVVTFSVEAQEAGADARSGAITLSYPGATDVSVTVNQAAGEGGSAGTTKHFVEVTSTKSDYTGTYLIVYKNSKYIFDSSLNNLDATPNYITISGTLPETFDYDTYKDYAVTIETYSTGYSILAASGKYMGRSANSNGIDQSNSAVVNSISMSNGKIDIVGVGGRKFNYNASSGKFRYFASSNTSIISLYELVEE